VETAPDANTTSTLPKILCTFSRDPHPPLPFSQQATASCPSQTARIEVIGVGGRRQ